MPIYMKYAGISGTVQSKEYPHWIELESASVGIGRNNSTPVNSTTGRGIGGRINEITVTKRLDIASSLLFKESQQGLRKPVSIAVVDTNQGKAREQLRYELDNVVVADYSTSTQGGPSAHTLESITLNFTKATFVIKEPA